MLRSRMHSKWLSVDHSIKDLEGANTPQFSQPPCRAKSVSCSTFNLIICISLLSASVILLLRIKVGTNAENHTQWSGDRGRTEHDATSLDLSNFTSVSPGKPLELSSLSHPPRIDRVKLMARMDKLEYHFADDEDDVNTEIIADHLRHAYGLSAWPPLIPSIPSSGGYHEEYSAETADMLLCSQVPCKILLPVWVRPMTPSQQMLQVQQLLSISKRLKRTLVLPNAGRAGNETEEVLLGLGTCRRYPLARYFDVSGLLFTSAPEGNGHTLKSAVPMNAFLDWVKFRPSRPSAQIVVIDSTPSRETHAPDYIRDGAEVRIDDQAERGRGKHKNCLSSRASKLQFGIRPILVVSPTKKTLEAGPEDLGIEQLEQLEDERKKTTFRYLGGITKFLGGEPDSTDETLSNDVGSGSYSTRNSHPDLGNLDVLVVEWGLGSVQTSSHYSTVVAKDETTYLDYSSRLYALASRILSSFQRPLVALYSLPVTITSSNLEDVSGLHSYLRSLLLEGDVSNVYAETEDVDHPMIKVTENVEHLRFKQHLGTIWLGNRHTPLPRHGSVEPITVDIDSGSEETLNSSGQEETVLNMMFPDDLLSNFSVVNASSLLSFVDVIHSKELAGLVKHGILEDELTRSIIDDIIKKRADRVFSGRV